MPEVIAIKVQQAFPAPCFLPGLCQQLLHASGCGRKPLQKLFPAGQDIGSQPGDVGQQGHMAATCHSCKACHIVVQDARLVF